MTGRLSFSSDEEKKRFLSFCKQCWETEPRRVEHGELFQFEKGEKMVSVTILDTNTFLVQTTHTETKNTITVELQAMVNTVTIPYGPERSPLVCRSREFYEFVKNLTLENEVSRCAAVILCDTAIKCLLKQRIDLIARKLNISGLRGSDIKKDKEGAYQIDRRERFRQTLQP